MSKKENFTALVTGAHGHTGTFLVKKLIELGYKITATDLKPADRKKLMTKETIFRNDLKFDNIEHPNVTFVPADLTDKDSLYGLWDDGREYDVVFHPASLYDYFAPLDILLKINVYGTRNLLEVICEKQANNLPRFIHWSTCGVYGEPEYEIKKDENGKKYKVEADETAPYDPPNWYSTSKMFQEFVVYDFYKNKKLPMTILRPMPIAGKAQLYGAFNIYYMVHKMGKMTVPIIHPEEQRLHMPVVHVEDLVDAAIFCFEHDETIGEAYNVGCDPCTQDEFIEDLAIVSGVETVVIPVWYRIYGIAAKIADWWFRKEIIKAKKWGIRPLIDGPMLEYITHEYYFSNEKLKKLGFKYKYPTPQDVTFDAVKWYVDNGWFDQ
ncbi:MAG: NAD-dependent epimerase/dehydratase family protein [Candidatus Helarchaeota archaeon]